MTYLTVCDISRHNGEIHFPTMFAAGAVGVAIRATVGDYYTDPRFYTNWDKAGEAGLVRTAYHVTRPMCKAGSQIKRFFDVVGDRLPEFGKYGWVADNECADGANVRTITDLLWRTMSEFSFHAGAPAFNYTRCEWFNRNTTAGAWDKFPLWVARYTTAPRPWSDDPRDIYKPRDYDDWEMWQWSADGNLRGREFGAIPEPGAPEPSMDLNRAKPDIFEGAIPPEEPEEPPHEIFLPYIAKVAAPPGLFTRKTPAGVKAGALFNGTEVLVTAEDGDWRLCEAKYYSHGDYLKRI